jgi:hypothetical protein
MFAVSTLAGPNQPDRILDPVVDCLTREVAARIVAVGLEPDIQDRVNELAGKANEGKLTAEERAEYELLIEKSDLLGILKSLARQVLAK